MFVDQTIFADDPKRKGNCVAACVATYLGIPLARVPHFIEDGIAWGDAVDADDLSAGSFPGGSVSQGNHWWAEWMGFMHGYGLYPCRLESVADALPEEVVFVSGPGSRGVGHQVLYRDGVLWHDPHPSRDGLLEITEVLAFRHHTGFDHSPAVNIGGAS